jgi:hypothetical protein
VAVSPFTASRDTFDFTGTDISIGCITPEIIEAQEIGCGDEVITIGLLTRHFGRTRNIPIARVGNIAAMPEEHVDLGPQMGEQEVYLIESRSIGGLSGSPVYLHTPAFRIIGGDIRSSTGLEREYLLGINIGLFEVTAKSDAVPTDEATVQRERFLEQMSAGIAVVVPIQRALEIIEETPELIEQRKKIRENKANNGFVPSAAKIPTEVPDAEAKQRRDEALRRALSTPPAPKSKAKK